MTFEIDLQLAGAFPVMARFSSAADSIGLAGPSGSGKSTLLNMIAGLVRAEGRLNIGGSLLQDSRNGLFLPPHRRRIGYAFQDTRLFPHLNVLRNLHFGGWMRGRATAARFDDLVKALDLRHLLGRDVAHLSGGERQRVSLARAMLSDPQLLLLDEPLANVDETRKDETLSYIERVRRLKPVPMIYVSHDRAEVSRMTDVQYILDKGQVFAGGSHG